MKVEVKYYAVKEVRGNGESVILDKCDTEREANEICQIYNSKGDFSYQVVEVESLLYGNLLVTSEQLSLRLPFGSRDGL